MVELILAQDKDAEAIAALAEEIWHEHYDGLLGKAQVDYMLEKYQSAAAVRSQLAQGYFYKLLWDDGIPAGYYGAKPEENKMFLSKIYVRKASRGRGLARAAFADLFAISKKLGKQAIYLTVNKHNDGSIAVYEKLGFIKTEEAKTEIGQGYFMDDYIMEKTVR